MWGMDPQPRGNTQHRKPMGEHPQGSTTYSEGEGVLSGHLNKQREEKSTGHEKCCHEAQRSDNTVTGEQRYHGAHSAECETLPRTQPP